MAKDKLVYCRTCGAQIAKSAKKCPQCGARQKKRHFFRKLLLLLIIIGGVYYCYQYYDLNGSFPWDKQQTQQTVKPGNITATEKARETNAVTTPETTAQTTTPVTPETTAETRSQTTAQTDAPASATAETDENGVTIEFKEFMDSYEEFMNGYCDFMESYDASNASMLLKYASLMEDYADFAQKTDAYNEDNLSPEDYKYYVDVMARVQKRLIDASVTVGQ